MTINSAYGTFANRDQYIEVLNKLSSADSGKNLRINNHALECFNQMQSDADEGTEQVNSMLLDLKVMEFLLLGKKFLKKCDFEAVDKLTQKVGMFPSDENSIIVHFDLYKWIKLLKNEQSYLTEFGRVYSEFVKEIKHEGCGSEDIILKVGVVIQKLFKDPDYWPHNIDNLYANKIKSKLLSQQLREYNAKAGTPLNCYFTFHSKERKQAFHPIKIRTPWVDVSDVSVPWHNGKTVLAIQDKGYSLLVPGFQNPKDELI